ncbi:MAG: hypothetical protein AAFW84_22230 [Cyanobacteria bacterium J06635_15]
MKVIEKTSTTLKLKSANSKVRRLNIAAFGGLWVAAGLSQSFVLSGGLLPASLKNSEIVRWLVLLMNGASAIFGITLIVSSWRRHFPQSCIFDRPTNRFNLQIGNIFKSEIKQFSLDEVQEARIDGKIDDDDNRSYRIVLVLNTEEEIELANTSSFFGSTICPKYFSETVQVVNEFLHTKG